MLLVTRPQPQADDWVRKLHAAGVPAQALPLLSIHAPPDADAVQRAWQRLAVYDGVMFVSPSAVQAWMQAQPEDTTWPDQVWAAAPGPGTARALLDHGIAEVLAPASDAAQFDSDSLWDAIKHRPWAGRRVLVVHGGAGRARLAALWRHAGATVDAVQAYRRSVAPLDAAQQLRLRQVARAPAQHAWLFSSGEAAHALPVLLPQADWRAHRAVCTHPAIGAAARSVGMVDVTVVSPQLEAIVSAVGTRP